MKRCEIFLVTLASMLGAGGCLVYQDYLLGPPRRDEAHVDGGFPGDGSLAGGDAASFDAARVDGGPPGDGSLAGGDAASFDAARVDAARVDAARVDGALIDGALIDGARVDAARPDGGDSPRDAGPLGPEVLRERGISVEGATTFESACEKDEVIVGFVARVGRWSDAIGPICSLLSGGELGDARQLPMNGGPGGRVEVHMCPDNHVGVGVLGKYGHSTANDVDGMTNLGLICANLADVTQLVIERVEQAQFDMSTSFEEDCTSRYLVGLTGAVANAYLTKIGGRCEVR